MGGYRKGYTLVDKYNLEGPCVRLCSENFDYLELQVPGKGTLRIKLDDAREFARDVLTLADDSERMWLQVATPFRLRQDTDGMWVIRFGWETEAVIIQAYLPTERVDAERRFKELNRAYVFWAHNTKED